jgi:hypothetical protein
VTSLPEPTPAHATSTAALVEQQAAVAREQQLRRLSLAVAVVLTAFAALAALVFTGKVLFAAICDGCGQNHVAEAGTTIAVFLALVVATRLALKGARAPSAT